MSFRFGNSNYKYGGVSRRARSVKRGVQKPVFHVMCSVLLALFTLFCLANSASAQGGKLGDDKAKVTERDEEGKAEKLSFFNVVNVDIHDILKFMSDETNLTIIASEKVKGKVTLVNLKDITVAEAMESLKTALNTLGFTTVRVNRTIVIISLEDAKTKPVRVQVGSDPEQIESSDEMITQIMPLNYADAAEMSQNLKNLVPKSGDMFADATNNSLVITDTSSNIRRIALILKELDTEPGEMLTTRVFDLRYAEAQSLEQTLNELFRQGVEMARGLQRLSTRGTDEMMKRMEEARRSGRMPTRGIDFVKGLVFIAADERTNKLIVTASADNMVSIEKMITELDTSQVAQSEIKIYPLAYGVAEDVAESLTELLEGDSSAGSRRGRDRRRWDRWRDDRGDQGGLKGIQGQVNVVSDDRQNAIVVVSDPQNFPLIESIIEQLDQQVDPQEVIKIIPLEYADAETTVQSLETLFQGEDDSDLPWWERERRRREGRGEQGEEITGIQGTVNMVADVRLNSIVVSTASANIPIIMELVKELDKTVPDLESSTKVIQLKNADAENLADILNNIYQSGGGNQRNQRFFWMPQRSSRSSQRSTITGTVTVSAYPRNNSLIVTSSSARNFDIIESLIKELDQPTEADFKYSTLIYPLEYSDANDMRDLLDDVFSEDGGGSNSRQRRERNFFRMMSGGSATMLKDMTTLAGQVRVNADEQTNTLVFTTPERNFEAIRDMVKRLDIVRGQVWLDITVLEVVLSDDTKLGLEWTWQEGNHLGKDGLTGQFGTAFNLSEEGLGFTYQLFNKNLTAMLHALTRENRIRVLTNTSLPTRDNQPAVLTKGRDIPYLEGVTTDNDGRDIFNYDFLQDIGITIEITPHIAKAGLRESKELLFNIGMGFQEDLDTGNISVDLRKEFEDNGIPLSDAASTLAEVSGYRWLINDNDRIYIITRVRDKISVSLKKEERRTVGLDITNLNVSNFIEFTEFNAPITDDSNITTYVDVEDGQQIVIGGVMKTEDKLITTQIPILGSIPFIGRLFKKTETIEENSELLILITPHIIDINKEEDREKLMNFRNELQRNDTGLINGEKKMEK